MHKVKTWKGTKKGIEDDFKGCNVARVCSSNRLLGC